MSAVLALAADFIERTSNPAYGPLVNEEYGLRLATLWESEGLDRELRKEASELSEVGTLTAHGWVWFLEWARAHKVELNEKLLINLVERWTSILIQVRAIDIGTQASEWLHRDASMRLEFFPHPFLRRLLIRCVNPPERAALADDSAERLRSETPRTRHAESVLVSLLQLGRDVTLDAASSLLRHEWDGQRRLLEFYGVLLEGLDRESQNVWIERLRIPGYYGER
ncbi:MAG: hypothetical protein ABJF10_24375 [Chthoniobacter sp.]|uniref:hypothetical protein n=1 Tax=Chthoniobacter sp. TaxID=2510640 RepID=UPI0032A9FE75